MCQFCQMFDRDLVRTHQRNNRIHTTSRRAPTPKCMCCLVLWNDVEFETISYADKVSSCVSFTLCCQAYYSFMRISSHRSIANKHNSNNKHNRMHVNVLLLTVGVCACVWVVPNVEMNVHFGFHFYRRNENDAVKSNPLCCNIYFVVCHLICTNFKRAKRGW